MIAFLVSFVILSCASGVFALSFSLILCFLPSDCCGSWHLLSSVPPLLSIQLCLYVQFVEQVLFSFLLLAAVLPLHV